MALLILACADVVTLDSRAPPPAAVDSPTVEELPGGEDTEAEEEPYGCADLYNEALLPTFSVEIADAEWDALTAEFLDPAACGSADPKPTHPLIAFTYGDERVEDATIRLKGNECFSWIPPKMQFVVAFNEVDPDGRFHGLRKIQLDAPWYDASLLHERLATSLLRDLGIPAPCANNARLDVNGTYYGIYANTEHEDHEFLERVYGHDDAGGTLYKYGTTAVANAEAADAQRLNTFWSSTDPATLATLGDPEQWVREWAAEIVMPDGDGYQCCAHNWMLYDHPVNGLEFIPYDLDYTFDGGDLYYPLSPATDPMVPTWGYPQVFVAMVADPTWGAAYRRAVATMTEGYEADVLLDRVDRWSAQIDTSVDEDPNKTFAYADHARSVRLLQDFLPEREAWLQAWVAAHP